MHKCIKSDALFVTRGYAIALLIAYGIMVITASQVQASSLDDKRDYINWAECLYKKSGYQNHKEPQNIYEDGCKWGTWVTFPNKIAAIEIKVGSWKAPEELFRSQDFIAMYKHPWNYWKHVLTYLSDPNYTESQKKISICGLENLDYHAYLSFAKSCYQLYKQQRLSEKLLQTVLSFECLRIHPLVTAVRFKDKKYVNESFLREIQSYVGATTSIGLQIEKIVSGTLAEEWDQKGESAYIDYRNQLPFAEIVCAAYKDAMAYMKTCGEHRTVPYTPPYFLMIHDHPEYYYQLGIETYYKDVEMFLNDPARTSMEKRLAIFAMQKLSSNAYSALINSVCDLYYWDQLSVHLIEDLLHCSFPNFCKYPFFILDHKSYTHALDRLLSIPTLPCGLKEMVRKAKDGQLITSQEMAYIKGYRTFCKTYFTLYETIPPLKDRTIRTS